MDKISHCLCCGSSRLTLTSKIWPALIAEWKLSSGEEDYINRQQYLTCEACNANLRAMVLAKGIMNCYGFEGLFKDFVRTRQARDLRVLEVNTAASLTRFLSLLPGHQLVEYPRVDMMALPFGEGTFDLAVHSDTLEHVPDPLRGLAECYRVLKPGGICCFTIPMIVDRLTVSRKGLPPSFHGLEDQPSPDLLVHTEFGADAWKYLVQAGFTECRVYALDHPSAHAWVGVKHPEGLEQERMVPATTDRDTFWEHIHRYRFAAGMAPGKRILDIACGEGYGTAALVQAGAKQVIGVDLSEEACARARENYGVDARPGRAEAIPLPDQSVDLVVSFETIEHLPSPEALLDECLRVLVPGGTLLVSTPDRETFRMAGKVSAFHCSELSEDEFSAMLGKRFSSCRFYEQVPLAVSFWSARTLCALTTPWIRVHGFWRLRHVLRNIACPHIQEGDPLRFQRVPVETILERDRPFSRMLNPYAIRKRRFNRRDRPIYQLAIATKPS